VAAVRSLEVPLRSLEGERFQYVKHGVQFWQQQDGSVREPRQNDEIPEDSHLYRVGTIFLSDRRFVFVADESRSPVEGIFEDQENVAVMLEKVEEENIHRAFLGDDFVNFSAVAQQPQASSDDSIPSPAPLRFQVRSSADLTDLMQIFVSLLCHVRYGPDFALTSIFSNSMRPDNGPQPRKAFLNPESGEIYLTAEMESSEQSSVPNPPRASSLTKTYNRRDFIQSLLLLQDLAHRRALDDLLFAQITLIAHQLSEQVRGGQAA